MRTWKDSKFSDFVLKRLGKNDQEFQNKKENFSFGKRDFDDNVNDLFHTLYHQNPREEEKPDSFFKNWLDTVKETKEFVDLKHKCQLNQSLAFVATKKLMDSLYDFYLKSKSEQRTMDKQETRKKFRDACSEMSEELEGVEVLGYMIGIGNGDSTNEKMENTQRILEYMKKMKDSKYFKYIVEMAGKYMRKAEGISSRIIPNVGTPIGVDYGNKIPSALPQELALLSKGGKFRELFLSKLADSSLLQYHKSQEEKTNNGAIIVCLDESGSMEYLIAEAKGFLFGMFLLAKEQKRDLFVIRFDTSTEKHEIKSFDDLMVIADKFMGGGTRFDPPLNDACDIIEKNPKYKEAEMFFITDGVASVKDETLARINQTKASLNFKIYSLCMANDIVLSKFSDKIFDYQKERSKFFESAMV